MQTIRPLIKPRSSKEYQEIVNDILDQITKGISKTRHIYKASEARYLLEFQPVAEILNVEGVYRGENHSFVKGSDYVLSSDNEKMLEWSGTVRPDENTEFRVKYKFGELSGLNDTNPGSVIRTIIEAVSKELAFLYEEMDQIYKSGFVDTAKGHSLDLVSALVGIQRKQPTRSMGYVTFWRESDPPETPITGEAILYDGRETYPLKNSPLKTINAVKGMLNGMPYAFVKGTDFDFDRQTSSLRWMGGSRPDKDTPFTVDYVVYQKVNIPYGSLVSTFATPSMSAKLFETVQDAVLKKAETGKWEADVSIRAIQPGQQGNVLAGAISLMPKPPVGVEHVINRSNLAGGADYEDDESLRERAKKAVEVSGKGTLGALKAALEGIEGIQSPPLIRENPDGIPGITKVVIDGGDDEDIKKVIEDTRAAGIRVEYSRPKTVFLDFKVIALAKKVITVSSIHSSRSKEQELELLKSAISKKIKNFVSSLRIGDDLIHYQLLSAVLATDGVHDIPEMIINVYKEGLKLKTVSKENIEASEDERLHPRTVEVEIKGNAAK